MSTRNTNIIILFLIAAATLVGLYLFPSMPLKMASHWNLAGEVDGYMSRFWGVAMFPLIAIILWVVFTVLPRLDPMKNNVKTFRKEFNLFIVFLILFLLYIYALTLLWNTGIQFDLGRYMLLGMGGLFYYVGVLLSHSKRNWFIGIRTPWTLSSDRVWKKTHDLGGKIFKGQGVLMLFGFLVPVNPFIIIIIPAIAASVFLLFYSYWEYRKL